MGREYVIRYGHMRRLGQFAAQNGRKFSRGVQVVVRTDRGLEQGEVLCEVAIVIDADDIITIVTRGNGKSKPADDRTH